MWKNLELLGSLGPIYSWKKLIKEKTLISVIEEMKKKGEYNRAKLWLRICKGLTNIIGDIGERVWKLYNQWKYFSKKENVE